jgi:hypothetical protein
MSNSKTPEEMAEEWTTTKPIANIPYKVSASDYMGDFEFIAEWVPYSLKGPKRQHGKGRWMQRNEQGELERVGRKEMPEKWRKVTRQEFMDYYGLGEEDMRNENT